MAAAKYLLLIAAITLGVSGQIALKTGATSGSFASQLLSPWTVLGLSCYALASFLYMVTIRYLPLSVAYPTVAMGYVVVAAIAHFAWREELSLLNVAGIALIVVGVAMLHIR